MSMDVGGAKGAVKSDINVTPLVDVMLVLLIIMMLIAPMLQKGVDVKLPQASNTADKPETQEQTVVAVTADKRFYLNVGAGSRGRSRPEGHGVPRDQEGEDRAHQGRRGRAVLGGHVRDGQAARRLRSRTSGLITERKIGQGGGQLMAHAHKRTTEPTRSSRARFRTRVRHERHAADRRAARAPRHLHGGAAADARRGSTSTCRSRRSRPPRRSADRPDRRGVLGRPEDHGQQAGRDDRGTRDRLRNCLRTAQGQDDVHHRRARRCATATSSR